MMFLQSLIRPFILTVILCGTILFLIISPVLAQLEEIDSLTNEISDKLRPALSRKKVAVADFLDSEKNVRELGRIIADDVAINLVNKSAGRYTVVDRSQLNVLLQEHKLTQAGLVDPREAAKLGKFAAADVIVIGTLKPLGGDKIRVTANAISVDHATVIRGYSGSLIRTVSIQQLYDKILVWAPKRAQAPPPQPTPLTSSEPSTLPEAPPPPPPPAPAPPPEETTVGKPPQEYRTIEEALLAAKKLQKEIVGKSAELRSDYDIQKSAGNIPQAAVQWFRSLITQIKPLVEQLRALQNTTFNLPQNKFSLRLGDPLPDYKGFPLEVKFGHEIIQGEWRIDDPAISKAVASSTDAIRCRGQIQLTEDESTFYKMQIPMALAMALPDFPIDPTVALGVRNAILLQHITKNDIAVKMTGVLISHPSLGTEAKVKLGTVDSFVEIQHLGEIEYEALPRLTKSR